jgi:amino acid transporter
MANADKIGLRDAISIGVGGMVGGGIFAVLGLAATLAKGGTPAAFLAAGAIALVTSYSYAHLSKKYPDAGGTVRFITEGYGKKVFAGAINNLLWVSYIIMLSLYASAFGSYAPNLFSLTGNTGLDSHIYSSAIIIIATLINYYSIKIVGRIESYAVIIKLLILLAFVAIGFYGLRGNENLGQLSISNWESPLTLIVAGMIIFVAYEGFELIANAAPDIQSPEKNIPRAYYITVIFVILLYLAISTVVVGSLPYSEIAKAEDYVLAEAAKPLLGQVGFTIITIAALISTFSAINASLLGGSRVSTEIADDGELPHYFTGQFFGHPIGLAITAFVTLVMANTLALNSISTAGSVGFLLVFATVNSVAYRRAKEVNGTKIIPAIGTVVCLLATTALLVHTFQNSTLNFLIATAIVLACFVFEYAYKRFGLLSFRSSAG